MIKLGRNVCSDITSGTERNLDIFIGTNSFAPWDRALVLDKFNGITAEMAAAIFHELEDGATPFIPEGIYANKARDHPENE